MRDAWCGSEHRSLGSEVVNRSGLPTPAPYPSVSQHCEAHHDKRLRDALRRFARYLLGLEVVGYIPFAPEAANPSFQLVSSR